MMLHYAITRNKGAALLTGDIGLGKTTISRKLLDLLDPVRQRVVLIVNPILTPIQILQEILEQLDRPVASRNRQLLVMELHKVLLEQYERGQNVVVLVDESHLIRSSATFEELRLLLNCQMNDQFLISLLLLGQTELRDKLEKVPALEQRISLLHRLRVAGYTGQSHLFSPDAIFELHKLSNGTPRVITQMADQALMIGMAQKLRQIEGMTVHEVLREYQLGRGEAA